MSTNTPERLRAIGLSHVPDDLKWAIIENWSAFSSCSERWSPDVPALGQCVVTACVLQDYLGGDLVRADVPGNGHYFNIIGGEQVDMTRPQFFKSDIIGQPEITDRVAVLSSDYKKTMYMGFASRVSLDIDMFRSRSRRRV